MSSIPFWTECTRCGNRSAIVSTSPTTTASRDADWHEALRKSLRPCGQCGDINVTAIELDPYGHIVREAFA